MVQALYTRIYSQLGTGSSMAICRILKEREWMCKAATEKYELQYKMTPHLPECLTALDLSTSTKQDCTAGSFSTCRLMATFAAELLSGQRFSSNLVRIVGNWMRQRCCRTQGPSTALYLSTVRRRPVHPLLSQEPPHWTALASPRTEHGSWMIRGHMRCALVCPPLFKNPPLGAFPGALVGSSGSPRVMGGWGSCSNHLS